MGHFIADLHAVIWQLQLERPILVGHSLGGQIVSQYAGVFPEVPRAVVNIDGMGPPMKIPDPDSEEKQLRTREAIEGLLRGGGHGRPMMDLDDATNLYLRFHPRLDPGLARKLVELGTEEHPQGGLQYKWDPKIHSLRLSSTPEIAEERFRWAECPVLLISAGEVDEFMWRRRGLDPSTLRKDPEEIRRRMASVPGRPPRRDSPAPATTSISTRPASWSESCRTSCAVSVGRPPERGLLSPAGRPAGCDSSSAHDPTPSKHRIRLGERRQRRRGLLDRRRRSHRRTRSPPWRSSASPATSSTTRSTPIRSR